MAYNAEYHAKWYNENKAKHLAQAKRRRDDARRALSEIKTETGCQHCGFNVHPAALEFHHPEDDKLLTIGASIQRDMSVLLEEARKCIVLCSNCHRLHHAGVIICINERN